MISAFSPYEACGVDLPHVRGQHYLHWTAEVYGLGKTYRFAFGLPPDAHLRFTSDHGVTHCLKGFENHELRSPLHLTFQGHRYSQFVEQGLKRRFIRRRKQRCAPKLVIRAEHPYINYWKHQPPKGPSHRAGTLVFMPHSIPEDRDYAVDGIDEFVDSVRKMPKEFQPVSLMIHYHDVRRGALDRLAGSGMRLLSAGNPMHPDFVDRLAEAVSHHRYVASTFVGTEAFLCHYLGARFALLTDLVDNPGHLHHGVEFAEGADSVLQRIRTEHLSLGTRVAEHDLRLIRGMSVNETG